MANKSVPGLRPGRPGPTLSPAHTGASNTGVKSVAYSGCNQRCHKCFFPWKTIPHEFYAYGGRCFRVASGHLGRVATTAAVPRVSRTFPPSEKISPIKLSPWNLWLQRPHWPPRERLSHTGIYAPGSSCRHRCPICFFLRKKTPPENLQFCCYCLCAADALSVCDS